MLALCTACHVDKIPVFLGVKNTVPGTHQECPRRGTSRVKQLYNSISRYSIASISSVLLPRVQRKQIRRCRRCVGSVDFIHTLDQLAHTLDQLYHISYICSTWQWNVLTPAKTAQFTRSNSLARKGSNSIFCFILSPVLHLHALRWRNNSAGTLYNS